MYSFDQGRRFRYMSTLEVAYWKRSWHFELLSNSPMCWITNIWIFI